MRFLRKGSAEASLVKGSEMCVYDELVCWRVRSVEL
jgi:hypothetical protein